MDYIRSLEQPPGGPCFLCDAAAAQDAEQRRQRLVLWTSEFSVVLINRFPYTNGHLLVACKTHKAELDQLGGDELVDLQMQTVRAIKVLKRAISPQGFNIGINLGR